GWGVRPRPRVGEDGAVTDTDARLPAGMDHAVLTCVDPLVDLAGVAAMAGVPADEVAGWSADDERFPPPVGELSGGPVFGYGEAADPRQVLAGGQWVAAVFDEQPDGDERETYQVLAPVALAELMARRDWLVWLTMHVQTMRAMHEAAADLLRRAESATPARRGRLAGEATVAATSLLVMVRALAAATVDKGTDAQCPHPHLCEAFALATIYTGELAALARG